MSAGNGATASFAHGSVARRATSDWMCGPNRAAAVSPSAKNG